MVEVGNGVPGVSLRVYILLIVGVHLWHLCLWRLRSYGWSMVFTNVYQRSLRKCCTHLIHCNVNTGYRIVCIAGIRHRKGKWIWLNKNKLKKIKKRVKEKKLFLTMCTFFLLPSKLFVHMCYCSEVRKGAKSEFQFQKWMKKKRKNKTTRRRRRMHYTKQ